MKIYTLGFTKKSAATFFELLRESGAKRVVDVRLNNSSQLAGFAKKDDLAYFLKRICRMEHVHLPQLAPTREMLDAYRKEHKDWETYERQFLALMDERRLGKKGSRGRSPTAACYAVRTNPTAATAGWLPNISKGNGAMLRLSIWDKWSFRSTALSADDRADARGRRYARD